MNCEAYIAFYRDETVTLYPQNIDPGIVKELCGFTPPSSGLNQEYLAIKRLGDIIYYAYIAPCDDLDSKVVVMVSLNSVVIDDIFALNACLQYALTDIAANIHLVSHDADTGFFKTHIPNESNTHNARELLRERFNRRFADKDTRPGPIDYTRTPGTDILLMVKDGSWMRFSSQSVSMEYRHLSLRQSIDSGNTVVIVTRKEPVATKDPETGKEAPHSTVPPSEERPEHHLSRVIPGLIIIVLLLVVITILIYNIVNRNNEGSDSDSSLIPMSETEYIPPTEETDQEVAPEPEPTIAADEYAVEEDDEPATPAIDPAIYQRAMGYLDIIENHINNYVALDYSADAEDILHDSILAFRRFLDEELTDYERECIMDDSDVNYRWRQVAAKIPDVTPVTMAYSRDAQNFIYFFNLDTYKGT